MVKWIVFNHHNGGYEVIDVDDVDKHIEQCPQQELLLTVEDARNLIGNE